MKIKAIIFRKDGFMMQGFAFGGEGGTFDNTVRYRSSLQNYLIDTGKEVILVDTGIPIGTPEESPNEQSPIYTGKDVTDYMSAFKNLGYAPEQVTKILLTHKHADHSGCLALFPNAKIYASKEEAGAEELKGLNNVVPVSFTDGPYYNFPASQKITEGVYFIQAKGHTKGNSIVITETDGIFYMLHGDVTYTDEALYENKVSVVYEDVAEARITLDRVRDFIAHHPTVYLSTHTPLGYENLESKKIIDLNNPPETIPVGEIVFKTKTGKYVCSVCGYVYDPAETGVPFEDLEDWVCPRCKQPKSKFNPA